MTRNVSLIDATDGSDEVEVEKVITLYSGICYQLNPTANTSQGIFIAIQLWSLQSAPLD